jgi:methionyl-tRNA formyltransferase
LVALLRSRFDVVAVVVEPAAAQRRRLLSLRRYGDFGWATYHRLRRDILGLNRYRRQYFADAPPTPASSRPETLTVEWINDATVVELLRRTRPDVTVIICTSILRKDVLDAAGPMTINVHAGYLPDYRGNHCIFFALYDGNFDKIGATIHFVDAGIDTGDIIEIMVPEIFPGDNAERLYCRADKLAIHRLSDLLERYEAGLPLPRTPQEFHGRLCFTRDRKPWHDLALWLRRTTRLLHYPDAVQAREPEAPAVTTANPTV